MGVWIEIGIRLVISTDIWVAPFVGVWIEINYVAYWLQFDSVAPFVGVWIEMVIMVLESEVLQCRSLRGSVD